MRGLLMIKLNSVMLKVLFLFVLCGLLTPYSFAEKDKSVIKLSPKVKIQDRDSRWFARLPCDQLHTIKPNSKKEQALLAQRKRQCINGYSAFY